MDAMREWRETKPKLVGYIASNCPNCGRQRLELFEDAETEKALGVECEKCGMQWLFNTDVKQYSEHDTSNPLKPPPPDNYPFVGGDKE